jgi:two-component system, OmpR family, sensor kinase
MRSLRRRLLISLWIAIASVAVVSAALAYFEVRAHAKGLLDEQLRQIATLVLSQRDDQTKSPESQEHDIQVAIWGSNGTVQYASTPAMAQQHGLKPGFTEVALNGEPYRLYTALLGGQHVEVAQPVDVRDDQAEAAAAAALLPMLLLMPVLWIVSALVIKTLLQPVRNVAAAVSRRDAFDNEPLQLQGTPKELVPLVDEINRLLARQGEAAYRERHFIADAAHALRTPLAALQLQADVLDGSSDPVERAARLSELRAGIQRTCRLLEQLLTLAKVESSSAGSSASIDVLTALREVHALYLPVAQLARVRLILSVHGKPRMSGSARQLTLICGNLLDNALRYSPEGGRVDLHADICDNELHIEVGDEGPGLPQPDLQRVLERFYRVPTDALGGSGLGLATVQAIVSQLNGRVSLYNRLDRSGLIARVVLPVCAADGDEPEAI